MLASARREAILHGHLLHAVHLVRFAPGLIELRPEPGAPPTLAPSLARMLLDATGERWTIALSREPGEPTLAEQSRAQDTARKVAASDHPLVRAILEAFPGASIDQVSHARADAYGFVPDETLGEAPPVFDGAYDDLSYDDREE